MGFLSGMDISASGLTAQRTRMDVISENIANIDTTRTEDGGPYTRKFVVLEERNTNFSDVLNSRLGVKRGKDFMDLAITHERMIKEPSLAFKNRYGDDDDYAGVRIAEVGKDTSDYGLKYDPTNPDADEEGYVRTPNVDTAQEMVDLMEAYRAYEANITAFNAYKDMAVKSFEIGV